MQPDYITSFGEIDVTEPQRMMMNWVMQNSTRPSASSNPTLSDALKRYGSASFSTDLDRPIQEQGAIAPSSHITQSFAGQQFTSPTSDPFFNLNAPTMAFVPKDATHVEQGFAFVPQGESMTPQGTDGLAPAAVTGKSAAFDLIGLTQLRNDSRFSGIDGSGYSVAVIDTGLDFTHPLLKNNYTTGYNVVDGTANPTDYLRHGTHVAGIVGSTDPNIGVATDVGLIGLQVFGRGSLAQNPNIEKALQWVYTNREKYNIAAVNVSIGGGAYTSKTQVINDILSDDVQRLEQVGVPVVTASGNGYQANQSQNLASPAIQSTIAVGAVWQDNKYAGYWWGAGAVDNSTGADRIIATSQRMNTSNMIFAPGALINSTVPGGGLEEFGGTSMAAPMVSGAIALMQEAATQYAGRRLSTTEILDILRTSADSIYDGDDEDDTVANTNTSYRRLNVYKAIQTIYDRFEGTKENTDSSSDGDTGSSNPALDPNGTLSTAIAGPSLNGEPVRVTYGDIGKDGTTSIGAKDVDMVKFTVQTSGVATLEVIPDYINRKDFDSFLRVFNQQGNELAVDDNAGVDNFSKVSLSLSPGTYYAGISGAGNRSYSPTKAGSGNNGATGTYAIRFTLSPSTQNVQDTSGSQTSLAGEPTNGDDLLIGTDSGDTFESLGGHDTVWGRSGDDLLKGDAGNDALHGEAGSDVLVGGGGRDSLDGGTGQNVLRGSGGNDSLIGGSEDDRLLGGRGNDLLRGGAGNNVLSGEAGRDVFVLEEGGKQTVRDFEAGSDQLKLEGGLTMNSLSFKERSDRTLVIADGQPLGIFFDVTPAELGA